MNSEKTLQIQGPATTGHHPVEWSTNHRLVGVEKLIAESFRNTATMIHGEDHSPLAWKLESEGRVEHLVHSANDLLRGALEMFTGIYPVEWPFFAITFESLPWQGEYWSEAEGDGHLYLTHAAKKRRILKEIHDIAELQVGSAGAHCMFESIGSVRLCPALLESKQATVQGICVQIIACADTALTAVAAGDYTLAGARLVTAYESLFVARHECELVLRKH